MRSQKIATSASEGGGQEMGAGVAVIARAGSADIASLRRVAYAVEEGVRRKVRLCPAVLRVGWQILDNRPSLRHSALDFVLGFFSYSHNELGCFDP